MEVRVFSTACLSYCVHSHPVSLMTAQSPKKAREAATLSKAALAYHRTPPAGKLAIVPTKPMETQRDLALAYSPGVAAACLAIKEDPSQAYELTARRNLVAVISNGTAVLGLGAIGALAAKPVMEGKAVLFKKFADIDVFDLEVLERDPDKFIDIVASLEPSFGGINLEDIRAPECFAIETKLQERMKIPVFHDDQHGTAIIVAAAVRNALELVGRTLAQTKTVVLGAGAAASACINLLSEMGLSRKNLLVCDSKGVLATSRKDLSAEKIRFASETNCTTLSEAMIGAHLFIGLSVAGAVSPEQIATMGDKPIVMALANPDPEIRPEEVRLVKPDAIIATGRSDYPNQVNNVLCFPFLFRGALDVEATAVNTAMKTACVHALADLTKQAVPAIVMHAYGADEMTFGAEYVIPKPLDPRLMLAIAPAVAKAAMKTGVARRPIDNFDDYKRSLMQFINRSGLVMRPLMEQARTDPRRVVFAEGEEPHVLQAVSTLLEEQLAQPILIGRRSVLRARAKRYGLDLGLEEKNPSEAGAASKTGGGVEVCDPESDPRYREYWQLYHDLLGRRGITQDAAKAAVRTESTVIAALMVRRGEAEAMVCGAIKPYRHHLRHIDQVLGTHTECPKMLSLTLLVTPKANVFLADTHIGSASSVEDFVSMTLLAATEVRKFGLEPKVALLSSSNFGSHDDPSAERMRRAVALLHAKHPELEVDGEMQADTALDERLRDRLFPASKLRGQANLLILPDLNSGNIAYNALKILADGKVVGPMLRGCAYPAHIVSNSTDVQGIVNMTAVAVVDAQQKSRSS